MTGPVPADECLGADDLTGVDPTFRLQVKGELAPVQRGLTGAQGDPFILTLPQQLGIVPTDAAVLGGWPR